MIKIYFFKKRHKKRILKEIYKSKELVAQLSQSSQSAKQNADELSDYINLRQQQAKSGDYESSIYLSCYLEDLLIKRTKYLDDYALYNQKYLNAIDYIQRLEKDLETL